MYTHNEENNRFISLHDCRAEKMRLENGWLSFFFPNGIWVMDDHPENSSEHTVRTDSARADFKILDEELVGIQIFLFRKSRGGKVIREEWETENFINAVNEGAFRVELIDRYDGFQSVLFKGEVRFDQPPYRHECEIILPVEKEVYRWNELRYDRVW